MPIPDYSNTAFGRYIQRMDAGTRLRFTMFRLHMMGRHRIPREAIYAENVVDRMLQEFMDRGPIGHRHVFDDAQFIHDELIAMGWGPTTEEAKKIEREHLRDRANRRWEG